MLLPPQSVRDLNTHHLFQPPATRALWTNRADALRRQILFSTGLLPMPDKTPLTPIVTGEHDGGDFIVKNVAIQTFPGFYLCGNLYLPKGKPGRHPAIVNPHGHWENGRLEMQPDVPKASPPPAPAGDGKGNLTAIGVNLARQGFVVFAYDMVGYNDTVQIPQHRTFGNSKDAWAQGVSLMGLQLWNSIRVVDYLASLNEVDSKRIGVTGASGGGTQAFLLAAVDDRITASVPVNMVSAYMQGGCLCENGPGLRVGTDNVEIAALSAPKPQLLVAATGDWTGHVPDEEWPTLRKVYDLYDHPESTACVQFNYGHNYNIESREAMYAWFGKWFLKDNNPTHFKEKPFSLTPQQLRVWTDKHPMPKDALNEKQVEEWWVAKHQSAMSKMWPVDKASHKNFVQAVRPMLQMSLAVASEPSPARKSSTGAPVLIVSVEGDPAQNGLIDPSIKRIVLPPIDHKLEQSQDLYFTCYNQTQVVERVSAIVDQIDRLAAESGSKINLAGTGQAGAWALLARGLTDAVQGCVVDCDGLDPNDPSTYLESLYAPGIISAGGLKSAAALTLSQLYLTNCNPDNWREVENLYKQINVPFGFVPGHLQEPDILKLLR